MDTLPVELIRLIYQYCDPESVRGLRLLTPTTADVGYEYLLGSHFAVLPWRDDVARLRSIARHPRLRSAVESVTFNLTEVHAENARQASSSSSASGCPSGVRVHDSNGNGSGNGSGNSSDLDVGAPALADAWRLVSELEQRRQATPPLHAHDPADVAAVLRALPSLSSVNVTFRQTPYDIDVVREAVKVPANTTMTRSEAIKSLNVLVLALQHASVQPVVVPFGPVPPTSLLSSSALSPSASSSSSRHNSRSSRSGHFSSSVHTSPISPSAPVSAAPSAAPSVASTRTSSPVSSATSSPAPSSPGSPTLPAEGRADLAYCHIKSFSIDRLPFELFRFPNDRRTWFQCRDLFAGLDRLHLAIDTSEVVLPQAKMKAVNGLAYIVRKASQLTHLTLAFHNHAAPRDLFHLPLQELLGESGSLEGPLLVGSAGGGFGSSSAFRFGSLTDFSLQGVTCDEGELRGFLLRHASTLQRLRLGGRGLARGASSTSMGGIRITNGTLWSLFRSLRGRLPQLKRLHLEGIFYSETETLAAVPENVDGGATLATPSDDASSAPSHAHSRLRYESYLFRATTDDDWTPASEERKGPVTSRTITSEAFEAYLLGQVAEYPGYFRRVGAA